MLAFCLFGFNIHAPLCDGTSSNLSLLKLFCGFTISDNEILDPWFKSPFDGGNAFSIVCHSQHVLHTIANAILN